MHNGGKAADFPSCKAIWSWAMHADEMIVMGRRKARHACADAGAGVLSKAVQEVWLYLPSCRTV